MAGLELILTEQLASYLTMPNMTNYLETNVSGTSWKRCADITIRNPLNSIPSAIFIEEKVINIDTDTFKQNDGTCFVEFDPTSGTFPVLDPSTGQPTGDIATHQELYRLLYSLYMQTALTRDLTQ